MKAVTAIKINAGNDANGNPRRAFVVLSNGAIIEAIDEEYEGEAALRASYPHIYVSAHIDVTPKEYRDMLKFHPSKGTRRNPRNPRPASGAKSNPRRKPRASASLLAAHAAAMNPKRPKAASAKPKRLREGLHLGHDYIELTGVTSGKIRLRVSTKYTTMAEIKAIAKAISARHHEAISAKRVKA